MIRVKLIDHIVLRTVNGRAKPVLIARWTTPASLRLAAAASWGFAASTS